MIGAILGAIIIGIIIGALARLILPGRQNISIGLTIIVGVVAALIGSLIASVLGVADTRGIDWVEHLIQLLLAIVGVYAVTRLRGRSE
ncbi:GlsB/YeaQ/YmgE family stress response membrane protein [Microtetraspora malaysiensis]|uniref:GlsB/YeaQ/YmgE family stress response membrane protein n=1 Tax=Microtetraspora malaysiensis TaxID=161358 RepID=A0ABW6SGH9_9ACTN|nr:transglycosylase [Microtetraspora malaysiensis]